MHLVCVKKIQENCKTRGRNNFALKEQKKKERDKNVSLRRRVGKRRKRGNVLSVRRKNIIKTHEGKKRNEKKYIMTPNISLLSGLLSSWKCCSGTGEDGTEWDGTVQDGMRQESDE